MGFFGKKNDGSEGDPAELSENDSEAWVRKNSMASVMVQSPRCGLCKRMEPTFEIISRVKNDPDPRAFD